MTFSSSPTRVGGGSVSSGRQPSRDVLKPDCDFLNLFLKKDLNQLLTYEPGFSFCTDQNFDFRRKRPEMATMFTEFDFSVFLTFKVCL